MKQAYTKEEWLALPLAAGADKAALLPVGSLRFDPMFRDICASNACGNYGRCHMCPPDVGEIGALIREAQSYDHALLYQQVSVLEDSFDYEGMVAAAERLNALAQQVALRLGRGEGLLHLSSGGCRVCAACSRQQGLPCSFPERAMASLEAYGINVYEAAKAAGLRYTNGPNTVTYFGAVLFREGLLCHA